MRRDLGRTLEALRLPNLHRSGSLALSVEQLISILSGRLRKQRSPFADLEVRPRASDLVGLSDRDIVAMATAQGLPIAEQELRDYRTNLAAAMPHFRVMVERLLRELASGKNVLILGRDSDLIADALSAVVRDTALAGRLMSVPLSGALRDQLPPSSNQAREWLGQFYDLPAIARGEERLMVFDVGFEGNAINWVNNVVRASIGEGPKQLTPDCQENPVEGLLVKSKGVEVGFSAQAPVYPEIDRAKATMLGVVLPDSMKDASADEAYRLAAICQLMPKFRRGGLSGATPARPPTSSKRVKQGDERSNRDTHQRADAHIRVVVVASPDLQQANGRRHRFGQREHDPAPRALWVAQPEGHRVRGRCGERHRRVPGEEAAISVGRRLHLQRHVGVVYKRRISAHGDLGELGGRLCQRERFDVHRGVLEEAVAPGIQEIQRQRGEHQSQDPDVSDRMSLLGVVADDAPVDRAQSSRYDAVGKTARRRDGNERDGGTRQSEPGDGEIDVEPRAVRASRGLYDGRRRAHHGKALDEHQ